MSKRSEELYKLEEAVKDLPDEEIRGLELFAQFLRGRSLGVSFEDRLLEDIRSLISKYENDPDFETFVKPYALRLESAIDQFFELWVKRIDSREGEGRAAVSEPQDYHMLDKYINDLEEILREEGEEKSS